MGATEVVNELTLMLDDPRWTELWIPYCRVYNAPKEVVERDMISGAEGSDGTYVRDGRLAVYAEIGNEAFRDVAIESLLRTARGGGRYRELERLEGPTSAQSGR